MIKIRLEIWMKSKWALLLYPPFPPSYGQVKRNAANLITKCRPWIRYTFPLSRTCCCNVWLAQPRIASSKSYACHWISQFPPANPLVHKLINTSHDCQPTTNIFAKNVHLQLKACLLEAHSGRFRGSFAFHKWNIRAGIASWRVLQPITSDFYSATPISATTYKKQLPT